MFKKYKNLRKFKKYYQKYNKVISKLIFVMLMASSLGMLLPYFISKRLLGITDQIVDKVIIYSILIMVIILFHHIFWYLWEKIGSILTNNVSVDIRNDIVSSFINMKYCDIKSKTSGYYIERINDDVSEVASFLSNVLGTLVDTLTNTSFLVLIYFLNYKCGIIFTIGIIVLYIIDVVKIKQDLKYTELIKELNEKLNTKMNENFKGIKDIKGLGIKDIVIDATNSINVSIANLYKKKDSSFALFSRMRTFLQNLIEAILILIAVFYLIPNNELTIVILLTIINYSGFMYDLVGFFAKMKDYFVRGDYKASRINEILDNNVSNYGSYKGKLDDYGIQINDLSYAYEDCKERKILNNININIPSNKISVFIGNSGSGKSTLFGILTKLLDVDDNKVFIGQKDINSLSLECFKDNICIINQDTFIINDTILNNIKIVDYKATLKEVRTVCKMVNIDSEIMDMSDKYNTIITENGNNLSGGQKQRIAIARALLKKSNILLLDEPTSALDKHNQKVFFDILSELKKTKTILIIAHKLDDYRNFDNVYELKNGFLNIVK